jgi:hypothetical protein
MRINQMGLLKNFMILRPTFHAKILCDVQFMGQSHNPQKMCQLCHMNIILQYDPPDSYDATQ